MKVCSKSEYKLCELCAVNMNATSSLQVGQAKHIPHVISDTGGRNYVWGDIIQLWIATHYHCSTVQTEFPIESVMHMRFLVVFPC